LLPHDIDHDAFMHHALHVLDVPAGDSKVAKKLFKGIRRVKAKQGHSQKAYGVFGFRRVFY